MGGIGSSLDNFFLGGLTSCSNVDTSFNFQADNALNMDSGESPLSDSSLPSDSYASMSNLTNCSSFNLNQFFTQVGDLGGTDSLGQLEMPDLSMDSSLSSLSNDAFALNPVFGYQPDNGVFGVDAVPGVDATSGSSAAPTDRHDPAFFYFGFPDPPDPDDFRYVERQANEVNRPNQSADVIAKQELEINRPAADEALGQLNSADQEAHARVSGTLDQSPRGRLALQRMLLNGKLTDPDLASEDGNTVLQALDQVAQEPLAKSINRKDLMSGLVQELNVPSSISQQNRGTCAATVVEKKMVMDHPAEFVQLVGGLASKDGTVDMANGDTLTRVAGTDRPDSSNRSTSSRLFQAATMDYANGRFDYDNKRDSHAGGASGLYNEETTKAMTAMTGQQYDTKKLDVMETIDSEIEAGRSVPAGLMWGTPRPGGGYDGAHEILVTRMDADRVYYGNPWGTEESMTREEFQSRVMAIAVPHQDTNPTVVPDDLRDDRQVVIDNLDTTIANLQAEKQNLPKGLANQHAFEAAIDDTVTTLTNLKEKISELSLSQNPTPEQLNQYHDLLSLLNDQALSVANQTGTEARDLQTTLQDLRNMK